MQSDRVEIIVDTGGPARTYEAGATRAGRRVEVATRRGVVEVAELTRPSVGAYRVDGGECPAKQRWVGYPSRVTRPRKERT